MSDAHARETDRPRVLAIAWSTLTDRATQIGTVLGGRGIQLGGSGLRGRRTAPVRYALNTVRTMAWLARDRPKVVVVQNPPIVLPLIAWAYCAIAEAKLVLDSHPVAFGRKEHRVWRFFLPLHRWLARRSRLVLVTVDELADEARSWGATALVLHEPPSEVPQAAAPAGGPRGALDEPTVLFVGVFAPDEPVQELVEAARSVPEMRVRITGDLDLAPPDLVSSAPDNVEFVGFLRGPDFTAALAGSGFVMALTTESTSVVRAAYEGVYARRPLIVSDWPTLRSLFPYAIHAENDSEGLAQALRSALARRDELEADVDRAAELQQRRWESQLAPVMAAVTEPEPVIGSRVHLIGSLGGHLELLEALLPILQRQGMERCWITSEGARAQHLRDLGEIVHVLPRLDRSGLSVRAILAGVSLALRERPTLVITSGAGLAVPFAVTSRMLGARLIFIETMARVSSGSRTGRLLVSLGAEALVQWTSLARQYPKARVCRPTLLEGLDRIDPPQGRGTFVTLGSHDQPFDRLLAAVRRAAEAGVLPTPVLVQSGGTGGVDSSEVTLSDYLSPSAFQEAIDRSQVVVTHGGAGAMSTVLRSGRRPIVMARRALYGEHVDDHQLDLIGELGRLGLVVPVESEISTQDVLDAAASVAVDPGLDALPSVLDEVGLLLTGAPRDPPVDHQ